MPTTTSTTSWPAKRLLLALSLPFFLFSCEEPTDIGLDVQPDNQVGVHYYDAAPIETKTVLLDTIITSGSTQLTTHLAGYINDPVFGKVTAKTYVELRLKDAGFEVGPNPQVTSVELQLNYLAAYGKKDQPLTLRIHKLTETIADDSLYNFSQVAYETADIGSLTFTPSEKKPTSLKRVFVSTNNLATAFGQEILNANLADQDKFRETIKGIALVPETANGSRSVAHFDFDRDADSSYVKVNYTTSTGEDKSLKVYLDRSSRRFHSVSADRAGSDVSGLVNNGDVIDPVNNQLFIQAGIGVRTVIKFPNLENLREEIGAEIAVNDARLFMPVVTTDTAEFTPPPFLVMAEAQGNRVYQPNGSIKFIGTDPRPTALQSVEYNKKIGAYSAQLGDYLQRMLYGKQENRGIVLYSFSNAVQVNRVRLAAPGANGMKLRIYYTKVQ